MGADGSALCVWKNCRKYVACHGVGLRWKSNVVIYSLKKVYWWKSTRWWHYLQTRMMKEGPENRTRWKHKWRWHNRGNVWEKMASRWTGEKNWISVRRIKIHQRRSTSSSPSLWAKCSCPPNTEKPKRKTKKRGWRNRHPEIGDPVILQITHVVRDPQYNCVETAMWHTNGSMANLPKGQSTKRQFGSFERPYTHVGKGELPSQSRICTASWIMSAENTIRKQITGLR